MKKTNLPTITIITGDIRSRQVYLGKKPLSKAHSLKVRKHSPDGFAWGYGGSGPAQLALAILLTRTDERTASSLYQDFKFEHVASWPQTDFEVGIAIDDWITARGGEIIPNEEDYGFDNADDEEGAPCGVQCLYAEGTECTCSCQARNHGNLSPKKQLKII